MQPTSSAQSLARVADRNIRDSEQSPLDPDMSIKVTCEVCGSRFVTSDRGSRVLNALREWDAEHKHAEAITSA